MYVKCVGQAFPRFGTVLKTPILTTGSYTGSQGGRYYFYVSAVTATVATVKYQFVTTSQAPDLFSDPGIDWATVTNTISVNLSTDKGVAKLVADGISIVFGTASQVADISLTVGQEWTARVDSFIFQTPIFKDSTPSQTTTAVINTLSGFSPFGDVVRRDVS